MQAAVSKRALGVFLCGAALWAGCADGGRLPGGPVDFDAGDPDSGEGRGFGNSDAGGGGGQEDVGDTLDCDEGGQVDHVDLLFVVDDSGSMAEEQAALRAEFPRLVRALGSGELRDTGGKVLATFQPVTDLHLGVVSTNLGLAGAPATPKCAGLGDDAVLQNRPAFDLPDCAGDYPRFLSYTGGDDPDALAHDFQCIATLGTGGCGYEQQLEAALKALWPSVDIDADTGLPWVDPNTGLQGNRVLFVDDAGVADAAPGQGDRANAGFLRPSSEDERSLLGIVIVTDEEDCSSHTGDHFTLPGFLPAGDPLLQQPINLRCYYNKQNLYSVARYVNGFSALRPTGQELVVFGAIVGVPVDLAALRDPEGQPLFDYADDAAREQWYARMLADERMIERPDDTVIDPDDGRLVPSCKDPGEAMPPRRIVEVARAFGDRGIVQSICQDEFGGAVDMLVGRLTPKLRLVCPE